MSSHLSNACNEQVSIEHHNFYNIPLSQARVSFFFDDSKDRIFFEVRVEGICRAVCECNPKVRDRISEELGDSGTVLSDSTELGLEGMDTILRCGSI